MPIKIELRVTHHVEKVSNIEIAYDNSYIQCLYIEFPKEKS